MVKQLISVAARLTPDLLGAYTGMGDTFLSLNQPRKAYTAYARSLIIAEDMPQAQWNTSFYFYRGEAFRGLTLYTEALADYEQAIRLDPNNVRAYNSKGHSLDDLKRYKEALTAYEQAIRLDPNSAETYHNIGTALDYLKRHKEAEQAHEKARQLGYRNQ